jgi:hypothetical protein
VRNVAGLCEHRDVSDACLTVCGAGSGCGVSHGMCVIVPGSNVIAESRNGFVLVTFEECPSLRLMEECRILNPSNRGLEAIYSISEAGGLHRCLSLHVPAFFKDTVH